MPYGLNLGNSIGPATRGFQQGDTYKRRKRHLEEDREYRDEQRDTYDPIDLETAMLRLKEARLSGELAEYTQGHKKRAADRINRQGERNETRDKASLPGDILGIGYRDKQAARSEKFDSESMPGRLRGIKYDDAAASKEHEKSEARHPGDMKAIEFGERSMDDQITDYDEDRGYFDLNENINNALGSFSLTGDPQILMDAYSMIDDGIDAEIKKIGGGRYIVRTNNGQPPQVFNSKEELLDVTQRVFSQQLQAQQPIREYGLEPSEQGAGPAEVQTTEYLVQAMAGMEEYGHMSAEQLRMAAFQMQKSKASDSPEAIAQAFFLTAFKEIMGSDPYGQKDPAEAYREAQDLTAQFVRKQRGGANPKVGADGGEESATQSVDDFVNSMIGRERQK